MAVIGRLQRNQLSIQDEHVLLSWRKINPRLFTCKLKVLDMEIREKQEILGTVTFQNRIVLCFYLLRYLLHIWPALNVQKISA